MSEERVKELEAALKRVADSSKPGRANEIARAALAADQGSAEYVHAECADHPGEIEYPDSGCAKCRAETSDQGSEE